MKSYGKFLMTNRLAVALGLMLAIAAVAGYAGFPVPVEFLVPGMGLGAVVGVKSTALTNRDSIPLKLNSAILERCRLLTSIGTAAVANGDSIASIYRMATIRSSDRVAQVLLDCTAITSAAGDIGLYQTTANGAAVVDADFFAPAQSLAAALRATDVTRLNVAGPTIPPLTFEKRVWELLGLAKDPLVDYDVCITLTAAATAAGTMSLQVEVAGNP